MARLVWVGVGAVGGIYAYRKGEHALEAVRGQGVLGTMQIFTAATLNSVAAFRGSQAPADPPVPVLLQHPATAATPAAGLRVGRFRISRTDEPVPPPAHPAIMDTDVVDITDAATRAALKSRRTDGRQRRKAR